MRRSPGKYFPGLLSLLRLGTEIGMGERVDDTLESSPCRWMYTNHRGVTSALLAPNPDAASSGFVDAGSRGAVCDRLL
jgi:hypothetical protein